MKITMMYRGCLHIGLLLTAGALTAQAGSFSADFNSGALPPGSHTNSNAAGGAFLETTGGVGNSGCLKITKNSNGQNGSFILDDLDGGNGIYGFDISFKIRVGGGTSTPADGFAICVAPDLNDTSLWGETGAGSGIRFTWGIYTGSGQTPPDPAIRVRTGPNGDIQFYKGYTIAGMETGGTDPSNWWADGHIRLNADGSLSFDYKGVNIITNWFVPNYQALAGLPMRIGIAGRTGGLNDNFWFDNLNVTTFTQGLVGISQQPLSQTALIGDDVMFDVAIGNPNLAVTYQWYSNNVAIAGATGTRLIVPNVQAGASGSKFKVTVTGPNNTVTSSEATLSTTTLTIPAPQLSFNFDDGLVPTAAVTSGTAAAQGFGGVGGSGSMALTLAANNQNGAFVVTNVGGGSPVYGFTARFKMLVGGGTIPPADGFAVAFGSDVPTDPASTLPEYEQGSGLGTGLRVTFDIFNNDGILGVTNVEAQPAPSIDVRYGNQVLGTVHLPVSSLDTGDQFGDVVVQLNTDGTLNVVYRGALIFNNLPLPGFSSVSGGNFAVGARTGGLNDNMTLDNFELSTSTTPGTLRIVSQPSSATVLVNHPVTFSVGVNDTAGTTYQWFRGASSISGATDSSYTIPSVALTDSGVNFSVQATKGITVTSANALLTVVNLTPPPSPTVTYNFDNGLVPSGTAIYGNTYVSPNGGVSDSGVLHLTDALSGQSGAFVVAPLLGGAQVQSIAVAFDVLVGGGTATPADGFSFNWAANLTDGTIGGAETGTGNGFSVAFRDYPGAGNNDNPPSPYIAIKWNGAIVATTQIQDPDLLTSPNYRTMLLRVDSDGKVYLSWGERVLYNGVQIPGFSFITAGKFGFYGRTGGAWANHWFDNIRIQATQSSGPLTIVNQPANATVISGRTATFNVTVSAPVGATYQWFKNNTSIGGATTSTYTTPATVVGDNGATFKVTATGPSGTATSSNAVLTVVPALTISNPNLVLDFNDCQIPAGTILNGSHDLNDPNSTYSGGYVDCSGGVTNSGVLKLTDTINGQGGTLIINDFNNNQSVQAFTAYFAARIGGGTAPPADGFSFVWAPSNDIPSTVIFGEDGVGNGLIVSFDIFDNGNETPPAPSIDVRYHGALVATKQMPYAQMETGSNFGDVYLRVSSTGMLDLQYNGMAIFNQVQLPGYAAIVGGEFALGARTGGLNENQWIDNIALATTIGVTPINLTFTRTGSNLQFTWPAGWKLQSSSSLASAANWQDVPGATSPWTVSTTTGTQFYRLAPTP